MPRGNRTGPAGMGPMTGRAGGYCAGYANPGFMGLGSRLGFFGRGRGGGRGGGRGWRNGFHATGLSGRQRAAMGTPAFGISGADAPPVDPAVTRQQELDALKSQAEYFEDALKGIKERVEQMEQEG